VTTGKQKNIVGSEMNGYLGKPSVTIPIITNDTVAKAVFLHEELHTRQKKNLSSPQRELDAYIVEGEYLKKVLGKKYIDFIKKAAKIYKKNGIGEELFKFSDQLFPDVPRLEKDIIRPVLMFLSAIEAGENTEEKFNKILIETSKFFKENDHTQYQN
jgi:hypothetical protein